MHLQHGLATYSQCQAAAAGRAYGGAEHARQERWEAESLSWQACAESASHQEPSRRPRVDMCPLWHEQLDESQPVSRLQIPQERRSPLCEAAFSLCSCFSSSSNSGSFPPKGYCFTCGWRRQGQQCHGTRWRQQRRSSARRGVDGYDHSSLEDRGSSPGKLSQTAAAKSITCRSGCCASQAQCSKGFHAQQAYRRTAIGLLTASLKKRQKAREHLEILLSEAVKRVDELTAQVQTSKEAEYELQRDLDACRSEIQEALSVPDPNGSAQVDGNMQRAMDAAKLAFQQELPTQPQHAPELLAVLEKTLSNFACQIMPKPSPPAAAAEAQVGPSLQMGISVARRACPDFARITSRAALGARRHKRRRLWSSEQACPTVAWPLCQATSCTSQRSRSEVSACHDHVSPSLASARRSFVSHAERTAQLSLCSMVPGNAKGHSLGTSASCSFHACDVSMDCCVSLAVSALVALRLVCSSMPVFLVLAASCLGRPFRWPPFVLYQQRNMLGSRCPALLFLTMTFRYASHAAALAASYSTCLLSRVFVTTPCTRDTCQTRG